MTTLHTSALVNLLSHLDIKYTDAVIPVRGEASFDPTLKEWVVRFRRDGVDGEYTIRAAVTFEPTWKNPNQENV